MNAADDHRLILLTPPGAGAIGVVRVIGPSAVSLVGRVFLPRGGSEFSPAGGKKLHYGRFMDGSECVDDVLVSVVEHGEQPALDISAHGGVRIIERILQTLEGFGARLVNAEVSSDSVWPAATAVEREATEAISKAKTIRAVRFLSWQREHLAAELERIVALFASDPVQAENDLGKTMAGFSAARTLIDGATVVLVGPPNSGKSTLFNALAGRAAALVSPFAGTTRDWVSQWIELDGIPIRLVDTAGPHTKASGLEREAVEASRSVVESAEVRMLVLDGTAPLTPDLDEHFGFAGPCKANLIAINKADRNHRWKLSALPEKAATPAVEAVRISAETDTGLDELAARILDVLALDSLGSPRTTFFTRRQVNAARKVLEALTESSSLATYIFHREFIQC